MRDVLQAAAKSFGWPGKEEQPDTGFGMAGAIEKGGYVATCAEVADGRRAAAVCAWYAW